jgi:FkbM family methyltransferase
MIKAAINSLHHTIAKSSTLVKLALLIRNQCNCVISYYLANSPNADKNGENLVINAIAKNCSNVIDVGANKGDWTGYFIKQNSSIRILMLEPSISAFEFLSDRFKDSDNITIIRKAVSNKDGDASFFEEPRCGETSSLLSSFSDSNSIKRKISVTTIDSLINEFGLKKVDFLKIDVEGFDLHVLKGAADSLGKNKIQFIQFEYNAPWAKAGSTLNEAIDFLKGSGYDVYILRKDGLYSFNYNRYGEFYRYANFVAVSKLSLELVSNLVKGKV